jgi:peptidoglycan/xylan/chitin deacetylase (PgdA/CDA1 family)
MRARYVAQRLYQQARYLQARSMRPRDWHGVRILGYHSISDRRHFLCVSPLAFRKQMELVAASDAIPIPLATAVELLAEKIDRRYVCVTFDDGYRDNLEAAAPVLRELGIPATIFVVTAVIDGSATFSWFDDPPPALSWDEVRSLDAETSIDIQAHTRTHPWLPTVDDEHAREEIVGSKHDLEEQLGHPVTSFCYPAGLYGPREVQLVRDAGYRSAVTTDPGVNEAGIDHGRLRRTLVFRGDDGGLFSAKLDGRYDRAPAFRTWVYRRHAAA